MAFAFVIGRTVDLNVTEVLVDWVDVGAFQLPELQCPQDLVLYERTVKEVGLLLHSCVAEGVLGKVGGEARPRSYLLNNRFLVFNGEIFINDLVEIVS